MFEDGLYRWYSHALVCNNNPTKHLPHVIPERYINIYTRSKKRTKNCATYPQQTCNRRIQFWNEMKGNMDEWKFFEFFLIFSFFFSFHNMQHIGVAATIIRTVKGETKNCYATIKQTYNNNNNKWHFDGKLMMIEELQFQMLTLL